MLSLSIRQVIQKFGSGQLIPSELCSQCLMRAKAIENLNAFVSVEEESARKQAEIADDRYFKGSPLSTVDGIPVVFKDNFCTKNVKTTCGSNMLKDFVPPYNATVVEKLLQAGAVMLGKSNLDEFAMGSGTIDSIHGPTRNVWRSGLKYILQRQQDNIVHFEEKKVKLKEAVGSHRKLHQDAHVDTTLTSGLPDDWFIVGGSSGGSAVAVASGAAFAALGSDTGGSTRNPAAYCGVIGLKPTYGLLSRNGLIPLVNSMDVPGIITRTVEDAALILNLLAGHDPKDSTTVQSPLTPVQLENNDISGVRVGIPKEYHCKGMSSEVVETWSGITDLLENAGAIVSQVSLPHTQYSIACYSVLNVCEVASNMARYDGLEFGHRAKDNKSTEELFAASRHEGFNQIVRERILSGNYFLLQRNYKKYFVQALKIRRLIAEDFRNLWKSGIDVLLTPITLSDAPKYSEFSSKDNREQCSTQDYCTQPVNMAGCPAITVPIKLSQQGLPLSLQLIGQNFKEQQLLSIAKCIEEKVEFPRLVLEE